MADLLYCGTDEQVSAAHTQSLLQGAHQAIWFPPSARRAVAVVGDRLWLLWRGQLAAPVLLGGGRIVTAPNGSVSWTNATLPGVRAAAVGLGYGGPTNMAFLHLDGTVFPSQVIAVSGLGQIPSGLSSATSAQTGILSGLLHIP